MNRHRDVAGRLGLDAFGRPEYDAAGLILAGAAITPPRLRLTVLGLAVCFGAGTVFGIMLEKGSPEYPPSPNVCRVDQVSVAQQVGCVPPQQVQQPPTRQN